MNYLWELWEFRNVRHRTTDRTIATRAPFTGSSPPAPFRFVSPFAAAPGSSSPGQPRAAPGSPGQQPGSSRAALPVGASLGFAIYVTNRDIFKTRRVPVLGAIFRPLRIGASPYPSTHRSAAFSRNFLFLFFYFGARSPILDSWPFLRP